MNERINKLTIKNNVKILETDKNKYILKNSNEDIKHLFKYLKSRNFNNIPDIVSLERKGYVYEYIDDVETPIEQKEIDMINLTADLHLKTTYYKTVGKDKYDEIYETVTENIYYIEEYYNNLITAIEKEVYMSPSHYLIARNFSKIYAAIDFCKKEIDEWQKLVEGKTKQRVCVVHNNLSSEHHLKNDTDYLISWDKYIVDTPVLDLYNFYVNSNTDNFDKLLTIYEKKFKLTEEEEKLLFVLLSIPKKFIYEIDEFSNTGKVKKFIDYLYKTNNLITPYYSIDSENE